MPDGHGFSRLRSLTTGIALLRQTSYKLRNTVSRLRVCSVTYVKVSSFATFRTLLVLLASMKFIIALVAAVKDFSIPYNIYSKNN